MKTLSEINTELEMLSKLKETAKETLENSFRNDLELSKETRVLHINETFISIDCNDFNDFKKAIKNAKPYITNHVKKYGSEKYDICSPFLFTIKNGYYKRELKFSYFMINDLNIWVSIDFNKIDSDFLSTYFYNENRKLYDSETHYINIPAHYKKFKEIRIPAYKFNGKMLNWYGGDKTILDTENFNEMVNELKNIKP